MHDAPRREPALSALPHTGQLCTYCRDCGIMAAIIRRGSGKSHTHQGQVNGLRLLA
jgi:hypothetical protein